MSEIDKDIVIGVLDAMGYDRVRRGLKAFEHEPVSSFCNCFATDAFAPELRWPRTRRARARAKRCGLFPSFKHNGQYLDIDTIACVLGVPQSYAQDVFVLGYEDYPDRLFPIIINWMDRYEQEHFEVTRWND